MLQKHYNSFSEARAGVNQVTEVYNRERLHGSVDMLTHVQAEQKTRKLKRRWKNYYKSNQNKRRERCQRDKNDVSSLYVQVLRRAVVEGKHYAEIFSMKWNIPEKPDKLVLHLHYEPGDVIMIDFAGKKILYVYADTGQLIQCQVFISVSD